MSLGDDMSVQGSLYVFQFKPCSSGDLKTGCDPEDPILH